MYGKHFASMYTGSMFGKPALVFAVLGYVIANQRPSRKNGGQCFVELNPTLLAATFSATVPEVHTAIALLCAPDTSSRSKEAEGRRLIPLEDSHDGPSQYQVVNGKKYREMRDEEERREYLRLAKQASRAKSTKSTSVNHGQPESTQAEEEVDVKEEADQTQRRSASRRSPSAPKRWRVVPEDWEPTPQSMEAASALGVDVALELQKFRSHRFKTARENADRQWEFWYHSNYATMKPTYRNGKPPGAIAHEQYELSDHQKRRADRIAASVAKEPPNA